MSKPKSVRKLLEDPARWTRGDMAIDPRGCRVDPLALDACAWCLMGAIKYIYAGKNLNEAETKLRMVVGHGIMEFNDKRSTTHADIMRVLEKADI